MHWVYVLFPFLLEREIYFLVMGLKPLSCFSILTYRLFFFKENFFVFVSMFITRLIIVMLSWIRKRKKKTREKKKRYAWFTTLFIGFHITEQSWLQITLNHRISRKEMWKKSVKEKFYQTFTLRARWIVVPTFNK